jgi:hypothetical protein
MTSQIETKSRGRFLGSIFVLCAAPPRRKSSHIETSTPEREAFSLAWSGQTILRNFKETSRNPRVLSNSDGWRPFLSFKQPSALNSASKQIRFLRALIDEPPRPAD